MKNSDIYLFFILVVLFCSSWFDHSSIQEISENFKTYNSTKTDFTIQYPENWSVLERINLNQSISQSVEFITPFETRSDFIQEIFIVNSIPHPANTTLDEFVIKAIDQFNKTYNDFKLISLSSTKLGNNYNATHLEYSYLAVFDKLNINLVMSNDIIPYKDDLFVLTFGTPSNSYYDFLPTIQQIISSFRIKN